MAVEVELLRDGADVQRITVGAKSLPELTIDWSPLSQEDRNVEHYGARFLAIACLACFTNTMWNELVSLGAHPKRIHGYATPSKEKDAVMRTHYNKILVRIRVEMDKSEESIFEEVKAHLDMGSLMTYSLPEGIEVEHDVEIA
jgi:hypothetical protein